MTDKTELGAAPAPEERWDFPEGTVLGHAERRGNAYGGWRRFLIDVVQHDFEESGTYRQIKGLYDDLDERLEAGPDRATVIDMDRLFWAYGNAAIDHTAQLAYALARTAPAGLEGWDDWLARARRFAGLEDRAEDAR